MDPLLTVTKPGNKYKYYPRDGGCRTDDEYFITSDDEDDRAYRFSPINKKKGREDRLLI